MGPRLKRYNCDKHSHDVARDVEGAEVSHTAELDRKPFDAIVGDQDAAQMRQLRQPLWELGNAIRTRRDLLEIACTDDGGRDRLQLVVVEVQEAEGMHVMHVIGK